MQIVTHKDTPFADCSAGKRRAVFVRIFCFCMVIALQFSAMLNPAAAQVVFSSDFDNGPVLCDTLGPNWTTTSTILSGVGTFTSNSNSCSLFTRGGAVSVTSVVVDLSAATGAELTAWVRKGDDDFSEDPDNVLENLRIEYLDPLGQFITLQEFSANIIPDGGIVDVSITLPFSALRSDVQFRITQLGGTGGGAGNGGLGFDFWHVDDFVITQTTTPPPPPTLTANSCDTFESGALNNWIPTDSVTVGINADTSNSPSNSLFLRHQPAMATSVSVNAPSLVEVTAWIRRGSGTFSERPDAGENLTIEFLDNTGAWIAQETFTGTGLAGEIFIRTYPATPAFRHSNFRIRLNYSGGSGVDFDYWHVDDICLVSEAPDLSAVKSVSIESDPINGTTGPFAIPGAFVRYSIRVENSGEGVVDANTISLDDILDPNTALFVGDLDGSGGPIIFTDGTGLDASGVTLNFTTLGDPADGVIFRDSANASITPVAPFDVNVSSFELNFTGTMNGTSTGGTPNFTIEYQVRVE